MNFSNLFNLDGRVALVTGGASGIGREICRGLAQYGAKVMVADLNFDGAMVVKEELRSEGLKAEAIKVNLLIKQEVEEMVKKTQELLGGLDILVNSGGINIRKPILEVEESDWNKVVGTNLKGTFLASQAAGRVMVAQRRGKIINLASVMGTVVYPGQAPYCASKGGVVQLTKICAVEWAPYNVNVNAIGPSHINTPLVKPLLQDPDKYNDLVQRNPMKRIGEPWEVVGAAIFLASDASNFITGQTIYVDGGWTAW
jgi:NAD(P)-dependent dehydrogenase (short-subunit alcohol dehydrogenase family)